MAGPSPGLATVPLRPPPRRPDLPGTVRDLPLPPRGLDGPGHIAGYASLFGVVDLGRDMVLPGAFAASLARRGSAGIRMLWQHDPAEPIGVWTSLVEDRAGLAVRGRLNLAVARARELDALVRQGAVDGLSIGFRVVAATTDRRSGVRRIARIDLWEVSLVTFPMLPGARLAPSERHGSTVSAAWTPALSRATAALAPGASR
ncbi:MAG: HK97 family phage prohead protease [Alsobacter sp.]